MALDPEISLQVRPPAPPTVQIQSPLEQVGQVLSLRGLMQQGELRNLQIQQEQQAIQDQQNLRTWIQQHPKATGQELTHAVPTAAAAALAKGWTDQQKSEADAHSAVLTDHLNTQKAIDRSLRGITDNPTKNQAIAEAVKNGWLTSDQAAPLFNYDVKGPEWTAFANRAREQTLDAIQSGTAALNELNRRRTEGQILETGLTNAARTIGSVKDAASYQNEFLPSLDPIVRAKMPKDFSDQAVKVIQAMGPKPSAATAISPEDEATIESLAQGLVDHKIVPTQRALGRFTAPALARAVARGYDQAKEQTIFNGVQRQMATLNGPQQTRVRKAVETAGDMLTEVTGLFDQWVKLAPLNGFRDINSVSLEASKHLPGEMGEIAQRLESAIARFNPEMGFVLQGGNAPTDHAMKLASQNLQANWNERTFRGALNDLRGNLASRRAVLNSFDPAGVPADSPYLPQNWQQPAATPQAAAPAAQTPPASTGLPSGWETAMRSSGPNDEPKQIWIGPNGQISTRPPRIYQGHTYAFDGTQWVRQ